MQGTSMASPHITGTVALMLEKNSQLTPDDARNILTTTARKDSYTGTTPNIFFGYGKVDALAAVQGVTPRKSAGDPLPAAMTLSAYPNPTSGSFRVDYSLTSTANASIRLYDMLGREVAAPVNAIHEAGRYSTPVDVRGFSDGVYYYTLRSNGMSVTGKFVVRGD
jgi:hypothetical protein